MTAQLLLETSLKTSGIVALALLATVLLRRRSAAMRHWILAAALACAAAAPALERFVPAWQVPRIVDEPRRHSWGPASAGPTANLCAGCVGPYSQNGERGVDSRESR